MGHWRHETALAGTQHQCERPTTYCVVEMQRFAKPGEGDAIFPDETACTELLHTAVSLPLCILHPSQSDPQNSQNGMPFWPSPGRTFEKLIKQKIAEGLPWMRQQYESLTDVPEAAKDSGCGIPLFRRLCAAGERHGD